MKLQRVISVLSLQVDKSSPYQKMFQINVVDFNEIYITL
jgi:hypothetical protein